MSLIEVFLTDYRKKATSLMTDKLDAESSS